MKNKEENRKMIKVKVLLPDGETLRFTAADMIQAARFIESNYYPYQKVTIKEKCRKRDKRKKNRSGMEGVFHG